MKVVEEHKGAPTGKTCFYLLSLVCQQGKLESGPVEAKYKTFLSVASISPQVKGLTPFLVAGVSCTDSWAVWWDVSITEIVSRVDFHQ